MLLSFYLNHYYNESKQVESRFSASHDQNTESANYFTTLFPPNSNHVMIHLEDYHCAICYTYLIAWEYVQTEQL